MTQNRRNLIVVFITLLIILETAAYISTTPRPQEQFFQLYVLGANRLAADYYPNNSPNLRARDLVRWYVGVSDFMGSVQLIELRVKLGNQTIAPPSDQPLSPSPAPTIMEFSRFLANNETWEFPFTWQILNLASSHNSTQLLRLQLNNQTITVQSLSARSGNNFRLMIELWVWNIDTSAFEYGWFAGTEHRAAWLQLWFNATSPTGP
jgi:hypothetical protein